MELYVQAGRFYTDPGKKIPIAFNPDEKFEPIPGLNERLRVVLVQSGTGIVRMGDKRISVLAPAALCINETEMVRLEDSIGWKAQAFYFHPAYINAMLSFDKIRGIEHESLITGRQDAFLCKPFITRGGNYSGLLHPDTHTFNRLLALFDSVRREIEEQSHRFWSCRARSFFIEVLFALVTVHDTPQPVSDSIIEHSSELADQVILYLNSNYGEKITISGLCSRFGTNRTTLQAEFRNAANQSVMDYLINLRVKLAALMLKDTSLTVTEISERLGFSDNAHFTKTFRSRTGSSPAQYRKQYRDIG